MWSNGLNAEVQLLVKSIMIPACLTEVFSHTWAPWKLILSKRGEDFKQCIKGSLLCSISLIHLDLNIRWKPKILLYHFLVTLYISREDLIGNKERFYGMISSKATMYKLYLVSKPSEMLVVLHAQHSSESSRVWKAFEVCPASGIYVFAQNLLLLLEYTAAPKPQIQSWLLRSSKALLNVTPNVL